MIEYDYHLEHDQMDEVVVYTPTYPTTLNNLVVLEGPNGSGKSTLLHLLALGCHGLKTGVVNESLRAKIRGLIEGRLQKLSFDIAVTDKDGAPVLNAKKTAASRDIELRDAAGKLLSSEQFDKKFKLIYDIPEDPLSRLEQLLFEIQTTQLRIASRVRALREACLRVQTDISDARDPEKIVQRKEEIRTVETRKRTCERRLEGEKENLKQIIIFTGLKFHEHYAQREKAIGAEISALKKAGTDKKRRKKAIDNEYALLELQIRGKTDELDDLYHEVSPILEGMFARGPEKTHYDLWRTISVREELLNPEVKQTTRRESLHFKCVLQDELKKLSGSSGLEEARLLRELLDLLARYQGSVKIPGAGLSVQRFGDLLAAELAKHQDILVKENGVRAAVDQLDSMLAVREEIVEDLLPRWSALDDGSESGGETESAPSIDPDVLQTKLESLQKQIEFYKAELSKYGIEGSDLKGLYSDVVLGGACSELEPLSEKDLRDRIAGFEESIAQLTAQTSRDGANIGYLKKDLEKLEKREPHQYQDHADRLKDVLVDVQNMGSRLNQYEEYIQQLITKKADTSSKDAVRNAYYEQVFEYLGRRVGTIRHVSEVYQVAKIDLLKREIVSTEGKQLQVEWLSTGEGQSAYLTGLLTGYDGRKMIALFDEVAMMDSTSLAAVNSRLVELYAADKLLVGIVVQKGEEARVRDLV